MPRLPRRYHRLDQRPPVVGQVAGEATPDLVGRKFTAVAPDALWVGDGTQIDTDQGPPHLATVEDLSARRLLGYAMSEHHDAALTVASPQMAVELLQHQ
ncbi:hypothetical protein ACTMTF_49135 [Nonomuraea sp. ZG12]|uniref:hypothetical protein n=1 Tax=Nonomuraea sp. ZG12 TaxID=3452207 RepID=UPI003F8B68F2